jgi:hypothetical protein
MMRLAAERNSGLVANLNQRLFESDEHIARARQSPAKRRQLDSLELQRSIREEEFGFYAHHSPSFASAVVS